MEAKEIDHRRSSVANAVTGSSKKGHTDGMRRPFGVAAFDVTLYLCGKLESDDEKHHSVPFLQLSFLNTFFIFSTNQLIFF